MSMYATAAQLKAAVTGAQIRDLPSGDPTTYLEWASAQAEQIAQRSFVHGTYTEVLTSAGFFYDRARIGLNGEVYLLPRRAWPVNSVTSITWLERTPSVSPQPTPTSTTVTSTDVRIEPDRDGDGRQIVVYEDLYRMRDSRRIVEFTVVYDGGYSTYPDWLVSATVLLATALLKRRGPQAMELTEGGPVPVPDDSFREVKLARGLILQKARLF